MMIKSRQHPGQSVSFRQAPGFGQGVMMDALRRHFTVEQFDLQFRHYESWAYRVRYGDYELLLSPGGRHMPTLIQGCFYICVSGPADQRAVLVFACVPPTEQIAHDLAVLESVLSR